MTTSERRERIARNGTSIPESEWTTYDRRCAEQWRENCKRQPDAVDRAETACEDAMTERAGMLDDERWQTYLNK